MTTIEANTAAVQAFFDAWSVSFDALIDSFRTHLANGCLLQQSGIADLHGVEAIVAWMSKQCRDAVTETIDVECVKLIAQGDYVASERIDYVKNNAGQIIATIPAMGIMRLHHGKICAWRDYFDTAGFSSEIMERIAVV